MALSGGTYLRASDPHLTLLLGNSLDLVLGKVVMVGLSFRGKVPDCCYHYLGGNAVDSKILGITGPYLRDVLIQSWLRRTPKTYFGQNFHEGKILTEPFFKVPTRYF